MISNYSPLTTLSLALICCIEDATRDIQGSVRRTNVEVNTTYGCSVRVNAQIDEGRALEDRHASVKIFIDERIVYKITCKMPRDTPRWLSDRACLWKLEKIPEKLPGDNKKSLLHLNAACEAVTNVITDYVHEYSALNPAMYYNREDNVKNMKRKR